MIVAGEAAEKSEEEKTPVEDKTEVKAVEEEGEGSSADGVAVHVEAVVESLELLLYSHRERVADIKIKGRNKLILSQRRLSFFAVYAGGAASVDVLNNRVEIKARLVHTLVLYDFFISDFFSMLDYLVLKCLTALLMFYMRRWVV